MITLEVQPTFLKDVLIPVPGANAVPVRFRFRFFDEEGWVAMCQESAAAKEDAPLFFARFVDGWEGKQIAIPFSQENLAAVLKKYPRAAKAILDSYRHEVFGAPEKN